MIFKNYKKIHNKNIFKYYSTTSLYDKWDLVVGIESHAQLKSQTKLFSGAKAIYSGVPNEHVSVIDAAMPGVLPTINSYCITQALKMGVALDCKINKVSYFDRKHYFYCDLPSGYQITQQDVPLAFDGKIKLTDRNILIDEDVEINKEDNTKELKEERVIRINHLKLEQDSGKMLHDNHHIFTFVDLNRAGIALIEIVTEPDIRSSLEAGKYVKQLQHLLMHIGTSDAQMSEGSLRCDINISVNRKGEPYGTRCEVKNVNSIRAIMQSIDFEFARQVDILEKGGKIVQESRMWDSRHKKTISMRTKEENMDYRYMPEPDLPALILQDGFIQNIVDNMPELPQVRYQRFVTDYKLSEYDATVILSDPISANYFEEVVKGRNPERVTNWITSELFGLLNKEGLKMKQNPVSTTQLSSIIDSIESGSISGKIGKSIIAEMFQGDKRNCTK
eukprot:TRINITY_DN7315_c0_g1_i2.p1 TRINITY_DN7315_c0_g1~~TRINITY_DN7315_c0_g1_i2.p1  ORF type:complete len:447 (-),score=91.48 TRINITY_DN7315_c0_g1_i2:225-1565(-)